MPTPSRVVTGSLLFAIFAVSCAGKEEPPASGPPAVTEASPAAPAAAVSPAFDAASAVVPATSAPASAASATPAPRASAPAPTTTTTTLAVRTEAAPPTTAAPASLPPVTQAKASAPPAAKLPTRPRPAGKITLPAKPGAVTFDHKKHAETMAIACATCHHPSRPEKPLVAEQQSCRECHTTPATPPVKTSLQAAFHNPMAKSGLCAGCHAQSVAKGKAAPVKCADCHRK